VLELIGLGGAAAAASPAVAAFLGGSVQDAIATSQAMETVCAGRSARFTLPLLEHRGSPLGIDACAVVETQTAPMINTGILHATDGVGQIGEPLVFRRHTGSIARYSNSATAGVPNASSPWCAGAGIRSSSPPSTAPVSANAAPARNATW